MNFLRAILLVIIVQTSMATAPRAAATESADTLASETPAAPFSRPHPAGDETAPACDVEQTRSFAEMLFREGQYNNAAVEYQRLLVSLPDSEGPAKEHAWLRAAESYRLSGRYALALRQLDSLIVWGGVTDSTRCRANTSKARCFHDQRMHAVSLRVLQEGEPSCGPAEGEWPHAGERSILLIAQHLHMRHWDVAARLSDESLARSAAAQRASLQTLRSLSARGGELRGPNPLLAGTLSTLIPGAGKVYAGRAAEGLFALLLNGLAIWQSVDGFHDDGTSSVKGWTAGAIAAVLYLGNVYGSINTARAINERSLDEFFGEVDRVVDRGMRR